MSDPNSLLLQQTCDAILARRQAYADRAMLYVLVDPALGDPLKDAPSHSCARQLRVDFGDGGRFEKAPYVLPLGEFGRDPNAQMSVEIAIAEALRRPTPHAGQVARSICGWLISTLPVKDLSRQVERNTRMNTGGNRKVFRFWDPRVMDFLDELLESKQKIVLLADMHEWLWLDRRATVKSWRAGDLMQSVQDVPASLGLSIEQSSALSHGRYANLVLDALQASDWSAPLPSQGSLVQAVRHGMTRWGIASDQDCVMYALYRVYYGQQFDEAPRVSECMTRARSNGQSPVAALEQVDASVWNTLPAR